MLNFIHNRNQIALYTPDYLVIAEVTFPDVDETTVNVNHTYVDDVLRGQGIAGMLMEELVLELQESKKKAILTCPYAIKWFENHSEYKKLLKGV